MFLSRWWLSWGWRRSHPGCEWISPPLSPKFSAKLSQHNQFRDRFICQQLEKEWVKIKEDLFMENSSFYWSSLALDFWVSDKQYQEQGPTWNVFAVSDIVWKRWTMIILPRLDEIFLFNVEPGRKEQGSRCWRCWTRPLGSRCPRSCLSSSPAQDIVHWGIEAVSKRLLARSHLNVFAPRYTSPRYTAPGYFPPGCFAGSRFSARCSVALPAGRKSLPSSFTKRRKAKLQKFQKGQKHDSRNHRSVVYQFPLNEVMFKTHLLVIIC